MSYFNHAYKKTMLVSGGGTVVTSGNASALTAGEIGIFSADSYTGTATVPSDGNFLVIQGNYNKTAASVTSAMDTIGGNKLHGGYAASVKSKLIKKNYVTRLWKDVAVAQTPPSTTINIKASCFTCNNHAQLRIDLKGERVMRALNRNFYHVVDANKCCTDNTALTNDEVADAWMLAINEHPILSQFNVASQAGAAQLTITMLADNETEFGDCSLDTRDWYNTQPLTMTITEVDSEGDACATGCVLLGADTTDTMPVEGITIVDVQSHTSGETVLRDLIMDGRYRQDGGWNQGNRDSSRFREIQKTDKLLAAVDRSALYSMYYIQHSVPRYNNPTGVFDNDQYVICLAAKSDVAADNTAALAILTAISTATGLSVETF